MYWLINPEGLYKFAYFLENNTTKTGMYPASYCRCCHWFFAWTNDFFIIGWKCPKNLSKVVTSKMDSILGGTFTVSGTTQRFYHKYFVEKFLVTTLAWSLCCWRQWQDPNASNCSYQTNKSQLNWDYGKPTIKKIKTHKQTLMSVVDGSAMIELSCFIVVLLLFEEKTFPLSKHYWIKATTKEMFFKWTKRNIFGAFAL